jgi:organic radical activating enzyme
MNHPLFPSGGGHREKDEMPEEIAARAKQEGITIDTISITGGLLPEAAKLLREVASKDSRGRPPRFRHIVQAEELFEEDTLSPHQDKSVTDAAKGQSASPE